jgi:Rad3-related DNA helicase
MESLKKVYRLQINAPTMILNGPSGTGKSYSSFYVRHDLVGKTDAELREKLNEIIADDSLHENEISLAKNILVNLK